MAISLTGVYLYLLIAAFVGAAMSIVVPRLGGWCLRWAAQEDRRAEECDDPERARRHRKAAARCRSDADLFDLVATALSADQRYAVAGYALIGMSWPKPIIAVARATLVGLARLIGLLGKAD
jgi:hypothetical protein